MAIEYNTLGTFEIIYNKPLPIKSSQVVLLLQAVLHNHMISRSQLQEILFEDRDISNPTHHLHVVVSKARKLLADEGLPGATIITRNGIFYWNDEIQVIEDAREFEKAAREKRWEDACRIYKGTFLQNYQGILWISNEARRYEEMFAFVMQNIQAEPGHMIELGTHAAKVQPYWNHERLVVEALLKLGKKKEAERVIKETTKKYMDEMGIPFIYDTRIEDLEMIEINTYLRRNLKAREIVLDAIRRKIWE